MHRCPLLMLLDAHQSFDANEAAMLERTQKFVQQNENCFERSLLFGHVTGSAWVVNETHSHVLMLHHAKLNRWLQPGGHCDGDADVLRVALREAREESGLTSLEVVRPQIFDVDTHWIPERGQGELFIPGHWHYDVRFLLRARQSEPLQKNSEANALRWVKIEDVKNYDDESLHRMALKTVAHSNAVNALSF